MKCVGFAGKISAVQGGRLNNPWCSRMDKKGVTVLCRDVPGFQQEMRETHTALVPMFKRKKKKHERHTVRTPPPPSSIKVR